MGWREKLASYANRRGNGSTRARYSRFADAVLIVFELALCIWCVCLFARVGQGALAPRDPARDLALANMFRLPATG